MTLAADSPDAIRRRWRKARAPLRLTDVTGEDFSTGGLVRFSAGTRTRFLILPADPQKLAVADFDAAFWQWWVQNRPNPFEGANPTSWGLQDTPTHGAAVRFDQVNGKWDWDLYLALHRNGALEFGLGRRGSRPLRNREGERSRHGFFLSTIVGRIWVATVLYAEVIARFGIEGPWEASLALRETQNSLLGDTAPGWQDFESWNGMDEPPLCQEPNVLISREVESWPEEDDAKGFAFWFGAALDDAWGVQQRRFVSRIEPNVGEYDPSRYR
jgi:hypothetical protein